MKPTNTDDQIKAVEEYQLRLRWLQEMGELGSEARYSTSTTKTVLDMIARQEEWAKALVADALVRLNELLLKRSQ